MPEAKILVDRAFFVRKVQPVLEPMGWTVNYAVTDSPAGYIVIHDISDTLEHVIAPELRKKFTSILDALAAPLNDAGGKSHWHYATDEDRLQWHETFVGAIAPVFRREFAVTPPSEPVSRSLPSLKRPVFDYTTLREDPENERRIREYSKNMIMVKSQDMVRVVKPAFAAGGWIYGGNHYGDGSVGLQVVLDEGDTVVAPDEVLKALQILKVPYSIRHRRPKATDEVVEDDYEYEVEDEEPGAAPKLTSCKDVFGSLPDPEAGLLVKEDENLRIYGVRHGDQAELRIEIAENIIIVESSYRQVQKFLIDAGTLVLAMTAERGKVLAERMQAAREAREAAHKIKSEEPTKEETESDGGKEPERDEFTEQRQSNQ